MQVCKVCNSNLLKNAGDIEGYRSGFYYRIYECKNCGVSYTDPCLVDEKIYEAVYKQVESVPGYSRYYELANNIINKRNPLKFIKNIEENYYGIINYLEENIDDKSSIEICELGCGQGYLTYALAKSGYRVKGIDISEEAIELARGKYGDYYFCGNLSDYLIKNNKPKYIIASELIEHISDPKNFINEILKYTDLDIKLILTTPQKFNNTNAIWDTELPPVHLWWYTKSSLIEFAKSIECEINFIDLSKFYKKHIKIESSTNENRKPILDEKYRLISGKKIYSNYELIKKNIKRFIPLQLIEGYRYFLAIKEGKVLMTNENSDTLCFILKKSNNPTIIKN